MFPWISQVFHSQFNSKAKGVIILIGNKVQFSPSKVIADKNDQCIIVVGVLYSTSMLLVDVYASDFDDINFARTLQSKLPSLKTHLLIFGVYL